MKILLRNTIKIKSFYRQKQTIHQTNEIKEVQILISEENIKEIYSLFLENDKTPNIKELKEKMKNDFKL